MVESGRHGLILVEPMIGQFVRDWPGPPICAAPLQGVIACRGSTASLSTVNRADAAVRAPYAPCAPEPPLRTSSVFPPIHPLR